MRLSGEGVDFYTQWLCSELCMTGLSYSQGKKKGLKEDKNPQNPKNGTLLSRFGGAALQRASPEECNQGEGRDSPLHRPPPAPLSPTV